MTLLTPLARLAGAALITCASFAALPALAQDVTIGDLTLEHPHARPNLPNRPSAAYVAIRNGGTEEDRLIAATSDAFGTIELHTVRHEDGVMKMQQVPGIAIPAGGTALLAPGGFHLMLFDAAQRFRIGDRFQAELTFEKAGAVMVTFSVEKPRRGGRKMDHSGHGGHGGEGHGSTDHSGHGSGHSTHGSGN